MGDNGFDLKPSKIESPSSVYREHLEVAEAVLVEAARRLAPSLPGITEAAESVVIYVGEMKGAYGCFRSRAWRLRDQPLGQIVIDAKSLDRGADAVLTTLLHELVHAHAEATGQRDTSRNGRYHNRRFAVLAQQAGLLVEKDDDVGHATPNLTQDGAALFGDLVVRLEDALLLRFVPQELTVARPSTLLRLTCGCTYGRGKPLVRYTALGCYRPDADLCRVCYQTLQYDPVLTVPEPESIPSALEQFIQRDGKVEVEPGVYKAIQECTVEELKTGANLARSTGDSYFSDAWAFTWLADHPEVRQRLNR